MMTFGAPGPAVRACADREQTRQPGGRTLPRLPGRLAVLLLLLPLLAPAQQLYRWVDDQGNVHYTDSIPPEYTEKGHQVLSPDGTRVREVAPAKTAEEIRRERELERLRAQQQRLIEQQKAADRVLLRSFRSVDDLIMARDGKLASGDVMIQVTKSNIRRQQDWLNRLRADAADLERAGKPVPERLREGIENSERSLKDAMAAILDRERQKQAIREEFGRDLARFRQLKNIPQTADPAAPAHTPPSLENLVLCADRAECDRLWRLARDYVRQHSTLPIESSGADVLMTAAPASSKDIGLIVSRIWNKQGSGASIFLDLQCRSYTATVGTCATPGRQEILDGFRPALQAGDARAAVR
jgi:hypothetical protein